MLSSRSSPVCEDNRDHAKTTGMPCHPQCNPNVITMKSHEILCHPHIGPSQISSKKYNSSAKIAASSQKEQIPVPSVGNDNEASPKRSASSIQLVIAIFHSLIWNLFLTFRCITCLTKRAPPPVTAIPLGPIFPVSKLRTNKR